MKNHYLTFLFITLFCNLFSQIEEIPVNDENIKLACNAIGFYEGTIFSFDKIESESPESLVKCKLARLQFSSAFQLAQKNLLLFLNNAIGETQVDEIISSALEEYKNMFIGLELNEDLLDGYFNDVEQYCLGNLPSPTKETLLYFKYIDSPSKEITDGHFEYFNTKGHSKSEGLEIKLKIPITYKIEEGERPHVVQRFNEFEGHFGAKATLTITEIPEKEGHFDAIANPGIINKKDMLEIGLLEGAKLRSFEIIKVDGIPFAVVESSIIRNSAVGEIEMVMLNYTTIFRNRVIILGFSTQIRSNSDLHFQHNKLLFKSIASSMIFIDQWK